MSSSKAVVRSAGATVAALILLLLGNTAGLLSAAASTANSPTVSQITAGLATAASSPAPDFSSTVPALATPTPPYAPANANQCFLNGVFPQNPANQCSFGDTASQKVMYVFGDSQAAMWIPAFDVVGQELGLHVIYAAKPSCGPMYAYSSAQGSACTAFQQAAISYANTLKPAFVFPIGYEQSVLGQLGDPRVVQGMSQVVRALAPSGAKVILLGSIPHVANEGLFSSCPLIHPTALANCETTPQLQASIALRAVAQETHTTFVSPLPLLCASSVCPFWVPLGGTNYLLYHDSAHINSTYAALIGHAFATLLEPYLSSTSPIPSAQLPQPPLTMTFKSSTVRFGHNFYPSVSGGVAGPITFRAVGKGCRDVPYGVAGPVGGKCRVTAVRVAPAPYSAVVSNSVTVYFAPKA